MEKEEKDSKYEKFVKNLTKSSKLAFPQVEPVLILSLDPSFKDYVLMFLYASHHNTTHLMSSISFPQKYTNLKLPVEGAKLHAAGRFDRHEGLFQGHWILDIGCI